MKRTPEPEVMSIPEEATAYAAADFNAVNEAFVEKLLLLAPTNAKVRALDLGTGPADIISRVKEKRPDWSVVGLDASLAMLRIAHNGIREKAGLVLADAKGMPFPNCCFDVVFSNSILHHISDPSTFWREVKRIAASNALIFFRDLFRPESPQRARDIVEQYSGEESTLLKEEFYRSLLAAYTPQEVESQLNEAGLSFLRVETASDRHLDVIGVMPA